MGFLAYISFRTESLPEIDGRAEYHALLIYFSLASVVFLRIPPAGDCLCSTTGEACFLGLEEGAGYEAAELCHCPAGATSLARYDVAL